MCARAFKGQESSKDGWCPNGSVEVRGRGDGGFEISVIDCGGERVGLRIGMRV